MENCKVRPFVLDTIKYFNSLPIEYYVLGSLSNLIHTGKCLSGRIGDVDIVTTDRYIDSILPGYKFVDKVDYELAKYSSKPYSKSYYQLWQEIHEEHTDLIILEESSFRKEDTEQTVFNGVKFNILTAKATLRNTHECIRKSSGKFDELSTKVFSKFNLINDQLYNNRIFTKLI